MDDIVRYEVIKLPRTIIVGKELRYSDEALNNGDNRLPGFWDKCYSENIFAPLESQKECVYINAHVGVFLDWNLGDGDFSYIVGMLMRGEITVPEGYFSRELAETDVALCWVKCKSIADTRTVPFESTAKLINKIGRSCANMKWCMDVYDHTRSNIPDDNGYVLLDCYIPLD